MTAFIVLSGMLVIYIIVIFLIIKNKHQTEIIAIAPPAIQHTIPSHEVLANLDSKENHTLVNPDNFYLDAIASFLLEHSDEPLKIIRFLSTVSSTTDKSYLLNILKANNPKLHDTITGLSIDTERIDGFHSSNIDVNTLSHQENPIYPELSPEEELSMGGIPANYFFQEMEKRGFSDFSEFIDDITENYIANTISYLQQQSIEEIGAQILSPVKSEKTLFNPRLMKTFTQGEKIATEIQKDIESQNNV